MANRNTNLTLQEHMLRECDAMAKHAITSGLKVPGAVWQSLQDLQEKTSSDPGSKDGQNLASIPQLAAIHERLAELVAPATPRTILMLSSESTKGGFWRLLGPVPLIRQMTAVAAFSLVLFIGLSLSPYVNEANNFGDMFQNHGISGLVAALFLLASAGLGASFSALFQAIPYVNEGTFDAKYNGAYWTKFVLGLMAGILLPELLDRAIDQGKLGLGRPTLAIVGGFSARVVYRILGRLAETVESFFRSETKDLIAAREQMAKARQAEKSAQENLQLKAHLLGLQQQLQAGAHPAQLAQSIEFAMSEAIPGGSPTANATGMPQPNTEPEGRTETGPQDVSQNSTATSLQSPAPNSTTLQPPRDTLLSAMSFAGMSTEQIRQNATATKDLQRDLRALGYLRADIDGVFGKDTEDAIRALQYDLLHNDGSDQEGGAEAPVTPMHYSQGRSIEITGLVDADTTACIRDMLEDPNYVLLPLSTEPAADNVRIRQRLTDIASNQVPMPFLLAILQQESNFVHFSVPKGKNEDAYIVVGFDHNDREVPFRITSRGYGAGQYTLFHHPPQQREVDHFMLDIEGNVQRAASLLRDKFDGFILGPTAGSRSDDRVAEIGSEALRSCKYKADDPRYLKDCAACMRAAETLTIESGTTHFYQGTKEIFAATQYHRHEQLKGVPVRAAIGCDWPYAARRYNGSGVNSYWYQAEVLLKVKEYSEEG